MSFPRYPCIRRATTSVLLAVSLVSGGILLLGDRFDVTPSYALTPSARLSPRLAACVADENMRLINSDQETCRPDEVELAPRAGLGATIGAVPASGGSPGAATPILGPDPLSGPAGPPGPPGAGGKPGVDGVSGFEIVTAGVAVPGRQSASGEVRCPAGKVALGGVVLPDRATPGKSGDPDDRMQVAVSAPLLPTGDGGYGWTASVKNTGPAALSVVVAAVCVALR